jgi:hypothetical protein
MFSAFSQGTLPKAPAGWEPTFHVAADRHPLAANLDLVQIVKDWWASPRS